MRGHGPKEKRRGEGEPLIGQILPQTDDMDIDTQTRAHTHTPGDSDYDKLGVGSGLVELLS